MNESLYLELRAHGVPPELIAQVETDITAEVISDDFRMDELDAVMHSVDKWFEDDDPRLQNNPATRAADAREIALKAEFDAFNRGIKRGCYEVAYAGRQLIGPWLSAALDDPSVCEDMKSDITAWFEICDRKLT